jgi:hypothetical protein
MSTLQTARHAVAATIGERRALDHFHPAVAEALDRGRPVVVDHLQTPLDQRELINLAVRLCLHEQAKLAVLPSPSGRGVIFVPV